MTNIGTRFFFVQIQRENYLTSHITLKYLLISFLKGDHTKKQSLKCLFSSKLKLLEIKCNIIINIS